MKKTKRVIKTLIALPFTVAGSHNFAQSAVKNVILMIDDGMGPGQIGLLEEYARKAPHSIDLIEEDMLMSNEENYIIGYTVKDFVSLFKKITNRIQLH